MKKQSEIRAVHEALRSDHIQLLEKLQSVSDENTSLKKRLKQALVDKNIDEGSICEHSNDSSRDFVELSEMLQSKEKDIIVWKNRFHAAESDLKKCQNHLQSQQSIIVSTLENFTIV
jgi:hypothetical protein